jgi:hypothetical protein
MAPVAPAADARRHPTRSPRSAGLPLVGEKPTPALDLVFSLVEIFLDERDDEGGERASSRATS